MDKFKIIIKHLVLPKEVKFEVIDGYVNEERYCSGISRLSVYSTNLKDYLKKYYSNDDFKNILTKYNGEAIMHGYYLFLTQLDAQNFIDDILVPFQMAKKLTEEN